MHRGWIRLYRKSFNNPYYFSEKFTKWQAWQDLMLLANHQSNYIHVRGVKLDIKRGQLAYSSVTLSERWKWSRGKVNRFLNELEKDEQIVQQKTNITTLISIINYDEYQGGDTADGTANSTTDGTANGQQVVQQTDTNNNDNNNKNVKNDNNTGSLHFDSFYAEYPKKKGKANALKAWKRKNLDNSYDEIMEALERFKNSEDWLQDNGQFIPHCSTWVNGERWKDDLDDDDIFDNSSEKWLQFPNEHGEYEKILNPNYKG